MKIYALEWDNGLDFDDHSCTLLGIYKSKESREFAKDRYSKYEQWPFGDDNGSFAEWEWEIDKDLIGNYLGEQN